MSMGGKTKIIMELNIVQSIIDTTNSVTGLFFVSQMYFGYILPCIHIMT